MIYTKIANLQERLLIYTVKNQDEKTIFFVNPILLPRLVPLLSMERLLPAPVIAEKNFDDLFIISPNFLVSFISILKIIMEHSP